MCELPNGEEEACVCEANSSLRCASGDLGAAT